MKWVNELKAELRERLTPDLSLILIPDWQIGSRVTGLIVDYDDERPSLALHIPLPSSDLSLIGVIANGSLWEKK